MNLNGLGKEKVEIRKEKRERLRRGGIFHIFGRLGGRFRCV